MPEAIAVIGDIQLDEWLTVTAEDRPVFHSEADLQHHLAWTIRELDPDVRIRLETRPLPGLRMTMDILLLHRRTGERVGVELKYPTRGFVTTLAGESFTLLDHSARDISRYDICKDVRRLEQFVDAGAIHKGLAITVTNDQGFWSQPTSEANDVDFRVHEGRVLQGTLRWHEKAGAGTRHGRDADIELRGSYPALWRPFSTAPPGPGGAFQALVVHVPGPEGGTL